MQRNFIDHDCDSPAKFNRLESFLVGFAGIYVSSNYEYEDYVDDWIVEVELKQTNEEASLSTILGVLYSNRIDDGYCISRVNVENSTLHFRVVPI